MTTPCSGNGPCRRTAIPIQRMARTQNWCSHSARCWRVEGCFAMSCSVA
jgi:hypothetical protein